MRMEHKGNIICEYGTNYACIPFDIMKDNRVSLKARGLYATCFGLPKEWELSVKSLQAILKEGRDAIYAALKELRQYGYLTASQSNNGCFGGVVYTLHATRAEKPLTENPYAVKPEASEKPYTENTDTENPTHYNTLNNYNTDNIIIKENNTKKKKKSEEELESDFKKRKEDFYSTIIPFVDKYGKEMCRNFFDYWTEPFKSNKYKMRFEDQKTWSIGGRLATWHKNNYGTGRFASSSNKRELNQIARRAEILSTIAANQAACAEDSFPSSDIAEF